jgi:membrane-associated phospholipid phosphatase
MALDSPRTTTETPAVRRLARAPIGLTRKCHPLVGSAHRRLPRGIGHLGIQFLIWVAFYFAYNITRGLADRDVRAAFENGEWIARTEARIGTLFEPSVQRAFDMPLMTTLMSYTYWLSQFVVVGIALFWVYFRHHGHFAFFRNWLVLANLAGLVCYVLLPTAPPRMLPEWGFSDTLAESASVSHETVGRLANQYAAMPSLHVMDAFIVGVTLFMVVQRPGIKLLWLIWPGWVAFAVVATGNHYWLDIAAGIAIAAATAIALRPTYVLHLGPRRRKSLAASHGAPSPDAPF